MVESRYAVRACEDCWDAMWNLGSHDGSWEAMMGLRWWPVESRVDLGKLEMLESHDASPFTLSMASKLSS